MRLLFLVTGVGLGDSTRIHAVIEAFKKKHPAAAIMVAGYDNSYNYFKGKYPTLKISGYKIRGDSMRFRFFPFVFGNYLLPFLWFIIAFRLRRNVRKFRPDVIISDFEPSGIALAKFAKKKSVVIFGFDPKTYEEYSRKNKVSAIMKMQATYLQKVYNSADYVIVPTLVERKKSLIYNYVGPIIRTLPDELPPEQKLMKELNLGRKPILLMLGGSDFGLALAKGIATVAEQFNELFIVFGSGFKLPETKNLRHMSMNFDFLKYLKVAKGLITLGGHKSLSEGIVYKKPMLIFPIQEHIEQQLNAYTLRDYAMIGTNLHHESLKRQIDEFISSLPALEKKIKSLKAKPNGAEQIVWFVEGLVKDK